MSNKVIFHPGTGTVINASEALIVDIDALAVEMGENPETAGMLLSDEDNLAQEAAEKIGTRLP